MPQEKINVIIAKAKEYLSPSLLIEQEIQRAYRFAAKAHEGQIRQSGELYVTHPVAATMHLMSLHPDLVSIQACLLHDIPEDTTVTLKEIEKEFGSEVTKLTAAMKKLGKIKYRGEDRTVENLRRMFLAISKDLRIAFIKLCDRLHNMETLDYLPKQDKKIRIAQETLTIYAAIAARLGIYHIKDRLEDLCFKTLYPHEYETITKELNMKSKIREKFITLAQKQLSQVLQNHQIDAIVKGRIKQPYSIFKKMQKKQTGSMRQLYDIFALRVIVKDKASCYAALGVIHEYFTPLSNRFKDYIAVPKVNNYQSLHTTVMGLGKELRDQPTEIQIRTHEMNEEAEYGIAAHFIYKEQGSSKTRNSEIGWIKTMEQISLTQKNHIDFLETIKGDLFSDRIFVLTPKGDVKDLPSGSTPVDFAYAVHSDIGNRTRGSKVDGEIVPLHHELQSGDVVEILTRKDAQPNQYWLSFVKTSSARQKIKNWFHSQNRDHLLKLGRELLNKQLSRLGRPLLDPEISILRNYEGEDLDLEQREHILETIGNGSVNAIAVVKKIYPPTPLTKAELIPETTALADQKVPIIIAGERGIAYKLSSCCSPHPSDKIIAYITRGRNVSIHRTTCKMLRGLDQKRFVPALWEQEGKKTFYQSRLLLRVHDTPGVLKDILSLIYKQNINITDISVQRDSKTHQAALVIDVDVSDYEVFDQLIATISVLDSIISVDGKILQ